MTIVLFLLHAGVILLILAGALWLWGEFHSSGHTVNLWGMVCVFVALLGFASLALAGIGLGVVQLARLLSA